MAEPHGLVSRVEVEMNLGWAEANPALFVDKVKGFKDDHPATHWQHHIDLTSGWKIKFIACRRETPFESDLHYVLDNDGATYLTEVGMLP